MASFLRTWIGTLVVLALLVVGLNLLVDPYDVFGTPRLAHLSLLKPGPKNHALLAKTYQIARAHPVTVLIGESSTHIGLDATDPAWPDAVKPIYNYGIPGAYSTASSLATMREALASGNVRNVVVALDFPDFLAPDPSGPGPVEDERRFHLLHDGSANPNRSLQVAEDMALSLVTMAALTDSLTTVVRQNAHSVLNLAPDGSSNEADFVNEARTDGMHDLFAQKEAFEAQRAITLAQVMADWKGPLPCLDVVASIIDLAHAHDVRLTLLITSHHVDTLEIYRRAGLWPRVEQFKVELAELVGAKDHGVTLWDFLDYSVYSTEPVPPAGDRHTQTQWFWEPTHFKKALGHIMIDRIAGASSPDFGVVLTPENVRARNLQVRRQRLARDPRLSDNLRPADFAQ
jgi:hypothetical protein